jgi:hypothetical protein
MRFACTGLTLDIVTHTDRQPCCKAVLDRRIEDEQVVANYPVKRSRLGTAPRANGSVTRPHWANRAAPLSALGPPASAGLPCGAQRAPRQPLTLVAITSPGRARAPL